MVYGIGESDKGMKKWMKCVYKFRLLCQRGRTDEFIMETQWAIIDVSTRKIPGKKHQIKVETSVRVNWFQRDPICSKSNNQ